MSEDCVNFGVQGYEEIHLTSYVHLQSDYLIDGFINNNITILTNVHIVFICPDYFKYIMGIFNFVFSKVPI